MVALLVPLGGCELIGMVYVGPQKADVPGSGLYHECFVDDIRVTSDDPINCRAVSQRLTLVRRLLTEPIPNPIRADHPYLPDPPLMGVEEYIIVFRGLQIHVSEGGDVLCPEIGDLINRKPACYSGVVNLNRWFLYVLHEMLHVRDVQRGLETNSHPHWDTNGYDALQETFDTFYMPNLYASD